MSYGSYKMGGCDDDCSHMCDSFAATVQRAHSNVSSGRWTGAELSDGEAAHRYLLESGLAVRDQEVPIFRCCFKGLGMGDQAAADIATESHGNVVKASGGLRREERLIYRNAIPLSPHEYYEGIIVDDRMGMQRTLLHGGEQPQVLRDRLAAVQPWNAASGLAVKLSKSVREAITFTGWGQQTEGRAGPSWPVRSRLCSWMRAPP